MARRHRTNTPSSKEPPAVLRWLRDWFTEEVEEDTEDSTPLPDLSAPEPSWHTERVDRRPTRWYLLGSGLAVVAILLIVLAVHRPPESRSTPAATASASHTSSATTHVPAKSSAHTATKSPESSAPQSTVPSQTAASSAAPSTCPLTQGVRVPNVAGLCASGMNTEQWQVGCESGFPACGTTLQAVINCLYAANKQEPITIPVVQRCALQVNT